MVRFGLRGQLTPGLEGFVVKYSSVVGKLKYANSMRDHVQ